MAGRRAVALSFPFFNGWNNWTEAEVEAAIAASGRVLQSLWEDWPASGSPEHVEVYNVNVRSLSFDHLPMTGCWAPMNIRRSRCSAS